MGFWAAWSLGGDSSLFLRNWRNAFETTTTAIEKVSISERTSDNATWSWSKWSKTDIVHIESCPCINGQVIPCSMDMESTRQGASSATSSMIVPTIPAADFFQKDLMCLEYRPEQEHEADKRDKATA